MKVVIEYLVLHEILQSVHLWHSTMKYMPFFPSRDKKSAMDPERVITSIVPLLFLIIALRKVQRFFSS